MGHTLSSLELKEEQEIQIEDLQPQGKQEKEMVPGVLEWILGWK